MKKLKIKKIEASRYATKAAKNSLFTPNSIFELLKDISKLFLKPILNIIKEKSITLITTKKDY